MSTTSENVVKRLIQVAEKNSLGDPIGVVVIFRDQAFLKAVWGEDLNREDISQALLTASMDEMSKS